MQVGKYLYIGVTLQVTCTAMWPVTLSPKVMKDGICAILTYVDKGRNPRDASASLSGKVSYAIWQARPQVVIGATWWVAGSKDRWPFGACKGLTTGRFWC